MRQRKRRFAALLVAMAMCVAALEGIPGQWRESAGATQAKINDMKGQLSDISGQIKDIQGQLDAIKDDKSQAIQQKQYLDEQIALSDQRLAQMDAVLQAYDQAIAEKQAEIDDLHAREERQYDLFCQRVRSMEEQGTMSYLSIIFNASSLSELLDNVLMVGEIMDYDNGVIETLQATRHSVEQAEAELETEQAEQQALRDEEAAARDELAAKEEEAAQLVRDIAQKEDEYQAALKQEEEEKAKIERDIQQAQKEFEEEQRRRAAMNSSQIVSESGFLWPLPGYLTLTSKFGWRTSPTSGRSEFHLGTDIPAPRGTAILAAKTGLVSTSTSHYSYGNYVVITHSDGTQTLYAHMSQRAVSKGQVVNQGQTIGYVGSTGNSTGNHLHFEIWKNGQRTNAESYFTLPFVRRY